MTVPVAQVDIGSWVTLLVLVLLPGVIATIVWSPMLASARLRALFRHLPLTHWTTVNYVLAALVLSVPWLVGLGWSFQRIGANEAADGAVFLNTASLLAVAYVVILPLVAGVGLPRLGVDWDPAGYGVWTWLLLVFASAWYSAIYTVPMFLFGIVVSLPF